MAERRGRAVRGLGVGVVAALASAGIAGALRSRPDEALTVDVVAETAWLPGESGDHLVLADAVTARPVTAVPLGQRATGANVLQVGADAVAVGQQSATVVDGRTWRTHEAALGTYDPSPATRVVAAGAAAWVVAPDDATVRSLDLRPQANPAAAGGPVRRIDAHRRTDQVRGTGDGTLWVLDDLALRSFRDDGTVTTMPLPPAGRWRALTVVAGRPTVVDTEKAHVVDPDTGTVTATWAVGADALLRAGDAVTVAAASRTRIALVAETTLVVTGDDPPPVSVDLDEPGTTGSVQASSAPPPPGEAGRFGPPVEQDGRWYVPDQATGEVVVVDAAGSAPSVSRHRVGTPGGLTVFGHHGRVWFTDRDDDEGTNRAGVFAPDGTPRPIDVSAAPAEESQKDGDGLGSGRDRAAEQPDSPAPPVRPGNPGCPPNFPAGRCVAGDGFRPGGNRDPGEGACPLAWAVVLCAADRAGAGGEGQGAGADTGGPSQEPGGRGLVVRWSPRPAAAGEPVMFRVDGADPGAGLTWTFTGAEPAVSAAAGPQVVWAVPGTYEVTASMTGGRSVTVPVDVAGADALPDITGLPRAEAERRLRAAGLQVGDDRMLPALKVAGTALGVRRNGEPLAAGRPIAPGWRVHLDVADGSRPVTGVASGRNHTCVVLAGGGVSCWGENVYGKLGDGTETDRATFVPVVDLPAARKVAVGVRHSCAILVADGSVRCWGHNANGELGVGTKTDSPRPLPVAGLRDVVDLAMDDARTCAVLLEGSVWCWGAVRWPTSAPPPADPTRPAQVSGVDEAVDVAVGRSHVCVAVRTGEARCWGSRHDGVLGDGISDNSEAATPVTVDGVDGAQEVAVTLFTSCARLRTGEVRCWGTDYRGLNGDGLKAPDEFDDDHPFPYRTVTLLDINDARSLSSGWEHACVHRSGGTVACWGNNVHGGLGVGKPPTETAGPVPVPDLTEVAVLSAGGYRGCAARDDGTLWCWGVDPSGNIGAGATNWLRPTRVPVP